MKSLVEEVEKINVSDETRKRIIGKVQELQMENENLRNNVKSLMDHIQKSDMRIFQLETALANMAIDRFGGADWKDK